MSIVTGSDCSSDPERSKNSHIFERFYRADKSRSRALGGSGIGLTIARSLAQARGGEIRVESAGLCKGSNFTLTLPLAHE